MKNLIFLRDYRGKLTKERFYKAGDVRLFQDWDAQAIIDRGVAVEFKDEPVEAPVIEAEPVVEPEAIEPEVIEPEAVPPVEVKPKSKPKSKKKVKK